MELKEYLQAQLTKRNTELEDLAKRVEALEKINEESQDENELKAAGEELDALKAKKAELEAELKDINDQIAALDKPAEENQPQRKLNFMKREERNTMTREEMETRAKAFKESGKMTSNVEEMRSTLISGGKVVTPTVVDGITDRFNDVSSIIDLVKIENCEGMGSNKIAYEKVGSTAHDQTEGSAVTASDPTFDFVTIQPTSKMVLSYVSNQVRKQTPLNYEGKVKDAASNALRRTMATLVTTAIQGSTLLDKTSVIGTVKTGKGAIDEKTLRNIVLAYGGSEGVEGNAWLFLNKTDLIAFGDVRGANEKKAVYEIEPNATNPNVGIIRDGGVAVNYCIDSNCTALNGTAQALSSGADKVTMLYGNPKVCELDLFGNYEIAVSDDYKFAENMLTIRGTVDAGADLIKDKGFVAVMLPKASA